MACYHPSDVSIRRKTRYGRVADVQTVPCGSCIGCRTEQARHWATRMAHEAETSVASYFLTLTYSDENLPRFGSLLPEDSKSFWKRLRRGGRKFSYYLCGEYGDVTHRPHYHALVFGLTLDDRDLYTRRNGVPVWTSPTIGRAWPYGLHEVTPFSYSAAQYVAGYVRKKLSIAKNPDHYEKVDPETGECVPIQQEFARMSNRPALGRTWFERYWQDVYPRDYVVINGFQLKPPRYYDKLLERMNPELMMQVREKRYAEAIEKSTYTLQAGEKIAQARAKLYQTRSAI